MKQLLIIVCMILACTVGARVGTARGADLIHAYDIAIRINPDATLDIAEKISYDFGSEQRHGIFRDIPVKYDGKAEQRELKVYAISVTDETGTPYMFETDQQGNDLRLKIGDPDSFVSGQKTYVIQYKVKGAINYFENHDELYWNAVGSGWDAPMEKVKATVTVPKLLPTEAIQHSCFAGSAGSTDACTDQKLGQAEERPVSDRVVFYQDQLAPHQSLTVVVGVPKGVIYQPTEEELAREAREETIAFLKTLLPGFILPLVALVAMLFVWTRYGRDPKGRGTIITQFDVPDQLTPLQVGTLMDERADQKDVSASIIYLATKGYLKIKRTEEKKFLFTSKDYVLQKMGNISPKELPEAEQKLYKALFSNNDVIKPENTGKTGEVVAEVKISDLKQEFYKDYQEIQKRAMDGLVSRGYFDANPQTIRLYYMVGAMALAASGFLWAKLVGPGAIVGCMLAGAIIFVFSFFMPKKSSKGVTAREHLLGLKDYLKVAESDRIKFHNAPEKNPQLFERFLPFAMVFGVEKEWAKQFESIYMQQPSWYSDPSMNSFNALVLADSLNSFSSSANSAIATAPSGGSGFSGGGAGGGFGGGGGGSW